MVYNGSLGRRAICEALLGHPAANVGISRWLGELGRRFGFIYIKLFGYPPAIVSRILARKVLRVLSKSGKSSVLDVGCSHGAFSFELARRGHSVVGVDINRESVEVGQRIQRCLGLQNISFYHMDILSNHFPDKQFDVIMMFEALEHIKDDSKVICEFNRLLKDEGILMVSVPYAESVEEYGEPVGACRAKDGTFVCIGEGGSHYRNGYNLEKMKSVLERNGFVITDWEYLCLPGFLESSILSFPLKYPLSLLLAKVSRSRVKLKVTAKKAPRRS